MNSPTDAELLIRSRSDPEAFGLIYDRHVDAVFRYLARRLGPVHAEDLVSEVFVRALEARHRTRPHESGSMLPWLYGIARNLVLKGTRPDPITHHRDTGGTDWSSVDGRVDADSVRMPLRAALAGLPNIEREVLLLVSWEQLTVTEAALVLGITSGAARTRLHRARAHAAAALAAVPHPFQPQEN